MFDSSLLWSIGYTLWVIAGYGGIVALIMIGVYFAIRVLSKPIGKALAHYSFVQEKKSVARLLAADSRSYVMKGIRNEAQLAQLMNSIVSKNGWKSEDVRNLPTWLLTGHLVMDANPNLPSDYSKRSSDYRETDMN